MAINHIKNYRAVFGLALVGMFFSACASTGANQIKGKPQPSSKPGLPAQTLAIGECGLFVWARTSTKPFILFSQAAKSRGLWYNDTQETITLLKNSDGSAYGQAPENTYQRPNGQSLRLALSDAEMIEDGMRYKSGTLTFLTDEGWEKVMPVIGLAACQTQA